MKNFLLPVLAASSISLATPLYYTFDGSVNYSTSSQLAVGAPLHFVILADMDLVTGSSGGYDYFSATLVQGEIINGTGPLSTDHSGRTRADYADFFVSDGNGGTAFMMVARWEPISAWNVGDNFYVEQRAYVNGVAEYASSGYTTYLTGVSETNPAAVPEPGTLALMGLGLAAAGMFQRAKSKRRTE